MKINKFKIIILSIILIFSISCNKEEKKIILIENPIFGKLEINEHKIDDFWEVFQKNEKNLLDRNNKNYAKSKKNIQNAIEEINSYLKLEIGDDGKSNGQMIITSDGITELHPIIKNIVKNSPKHENWNFQALRQRQKLPFTFSYKNKKYDTNKIKIAYLEDGKNYRIRLFFEDMSQINEKDDVMFFVIDLLLGEEDAQKYINYIQIDNQKDSNITYYNLEDFRKRIDKGKE